MMTISKLRIFGIAILMLAVSMTGHDANAQDQDAIKWFKVGLAENDYLKKIDAFRKAINIDPEFVGALYNLGMAYRSQSDLINAEMYLRRAYSLRQDKLEPTLANLIPFELGATLRRLDRLEEAETILRQARDETSDPKAVTSFTYELARVLYAQGRFSETLTELRDGLSTAGEMRSQFESLLQSSGNAMTLDRKFREAEQLEASGDFARARMLFEDIRRESPNHRGIETKITALSSRLDKQTTINALESIYAQGRRFEEQGELDLALSTYEELLQQSNDYKDTAGRILTIRESLDKQRQNERLQSEFEIGLEAAKAHDWLRAIISFEKVTSIDPSFRDVRTRLRQARRNLDNEKNELIASRYYEEGQTALEKGDYEHALAIFERLHNLDQDYRDVASLLAETEQLVESNVAGQLPAQMASSYISADSLYTTAATLMAQQQWSQALTLLEQAQQQSPDNLEINKLLAEVRANISISENLSMRDSSKSPGGSWLMISGALTALLVLPVIGFLRFSPRARAGLYRLRGQHERAALIYEQMLALNPSKAKLYPLLAESYLKTQRSDEQAVKVFKTILQLNLPVPYRAQINSIVTQNYLDNGQTDDDAIDILEKELQAAQQRHDEHSM